MAAPKTWGYTRDQEFGNEMLVSWCDGDLTAMLAKEIDERLLANADARREVASWARAAHDATLFDGKDWLQDVREGLVNQCKAVIGD